MNENKKYLLALIGLVFALLFLRLLYLQVVEQERYQSQAIENAAKTVRAPAPRGIIYDRSGKVLVENQAIFSVHVLPYVLAAQPKEKQDKILAELSLLLGEKVVYKVTAVEPIIIKDKVALETAIKIEEKKNELLGVVVTSQPIRRYPHGSLAAHVLGYVGEIEAQELGRLRGKNYQLKSLVGKDGVEKVYDEQLRGIDGGQKIEVDVHGTPLRILESVNPQPGADLKLTIDLELQKEVEKNLAGQEGAVVVMDVLSGEVLALASYPTYDPNIFVWRQNNSKWQELMRKKSPLINRALAIYPPGSIFKPITLTAALEEKIAKADEVLNCPGYYQVNKRIAKCWLAIGHGAIAVKEGLVWSCDVVFYELGRRLGPELLARYAKGFGLGQKSGIDLPQEKMGTVPTEEWKKKYLHESWYAGDSINYGIGQGFLEVTPLQMAVVYASLATGKMLKPYVVANISDQQGRQIWRAKKPVIRRPPISEANLLIVKKALRDVVRRGTGIAARIQGLPAAGKTGTAENPGQAHAWFICYAPDDDPEVVIAVFIAHGAHGDRASAYVARDILKWYQKNRLKKVYPEEVFAAQYILRGQRQVPYRSLH